MSQKSMIENLMFDTQYQDAYQEDDNQMNNLYELNNLEISREIQSIIIGGSIPDTEQEINDCLFTNKKICVSPNEINLMKEYLIERGLKVPKTDLEVVELIKKELGVSTESAIWENSHFKEFAGDSKARNILRKMFKPVGPSDSVALLDNFNIDETLTQWCENSEKLFGKKFYHIPYQMIDFARTGTALAYTNLEDIIVKGYDSFGVVLNTDVSSGRGKHWFCIFGDLAHKGVDKDPYALEFFNSSGNPPMDEVQIWMKKTVHDLKKDTGKVCVIQRSMYKRVQYSNHECGVWSLMYIYSRLKGRDPHWFYEVKADDKDMIEMRKQFFRKKN